MTCLWVGRGERATGWAGWKLLGATWLGALLVALGIGWIDAAPAPATLVQVEIKESGLTPRSANIERGGTVVWTNTTSRMLQIASEAGLFASGPIKASERFTQTFSTDGTYYYAAIGDREWLGAVVVGSGRPSFGSGVGAVSLPGVDAPPLPPIDGYAYPYGGYGYGSGYGSAPPLGLGYAYGCGNGLPSAYFGYPGWGVPPYPR